MLTPSTLKVKLTHNTAKKCHYTLQIPLWQHVWSKMAACPTHLKLTATEHLSKPIFVLCKAHLGI